MIIRPSETGKPYAITALSTSGTYRPGARWHSSSYAITEYGLHWHTHSDEHADASRTSPCMILALSIGRKWLRGDSQVTFRIPCGRITISHGIVEFQASLVIQVDQLCHRASCMLSALLYLGNDLTKADRILEDPGVGWGLVLRFWDQARRSLRQSNDRVLLAGSVD